MPFEPVYEPDTFRQSLLTLADKCSWSAYLSVLTGGTTSHAMFRGTAFHATAQRIIETLQQTGNVRIAPDDAKAIMLEVLSENDWTVPAKEMDELRVLVHHFADYFTLPDGARAEVPVSMVVAGKTVTGTIDLMWVDGDTVHIRDWKAGWGLYSQDDVSGKDSNTGEPRGARAAQLIIYALLADSLGLAVNRFDCAFVFPMFVTEEGMRERGVVIARPELIEHREWLNGLVASLQHRFGKQSFSAVPGSHCSRCPAAHMCPLPSKVKMSGPFERDPEEVAVDAMFLARDYKQLAKELRGYAKSFGSVRAGTDMEFAFRDTASGPRFGLYKVGP